MDKRDNLPTGNVNFGKYRIEKELGRGGMGVVYKAYDTQYDIYVALKLITKQGFSEKDLKQFSQEVKTLARLNHPNIVRFYEFATAPKLYFTMEYVDGHTLAESIENYQVKSLWLINAMITVCQALDYSHKQGVIHRDIKPSNIMIDNSGAVKIMDFGVAKQDNKQSLSKSGRIVGTMHYMAPEQVLGKATFKSDIYSVGATLYEALTYRTVYEGDSQMNLCYQIIRNNFIPPRRICPKISPYLEAICIKCLQKNVRKRYDSFSELGHEFRNFKLNKPITAKKYTSWDAFCKFVNRHRIVCTSLIFTFFVLIASLVITIHALNKSDRTSKELELLNNAMLDSLLYASKRNMDFFYDPNFLKPVHKIFSQSVSLQVGEKYRGLRGNILSESRRNEDLIQAIEDYSVAIQHQPHYFLYTNRGKTYQKIGRKKEALDDYKKAITIDPRRYLAYFRRAELYFDSEKEKALLDYTKTIEVNPAYHHAYYGRGRIYYNLKKYNEAIKDFDQTLRIFSKHRNAHYWKGLTFRMQGKLDLAIKSFTREIEQNRQSSQSYFNRGAVYILLEKFRMAKSDFETAISMNPKLYNAYVQRGILRYRFLRLFEEAHNDFTFVIKKDHRNAQAYLHRGVLYYKKNQFVKSYRDLLKSCEIDSNNATTYYHLNICCKALGNDKEAEKFLRKMKVLEKK
ncbi:protein kinase [Candidatus Uabimicrobium sp. HlEnr_7]|uniref:protein kinase domain-containing protein n=1 Tax=Candidatus Uabimicrobium helgolandensis TaxID=3095367 RepID=UPI003556874A